ncbi:MAG: hypothetical protein GF344_13570 [Chitinivibrionales bacterium]|nr:hypothetical protein [Chitinivibrionales bacterium]MBD3357760.1 hypothetical protein [Chitinivibrionales bacterium]
MTEFKPKYDFTMWFAYAVPALIAWRYAERDIAVGDITSAVVAAAGIVTGLVYVLSHLPRTIEFSDIGLRTTMVVGIRRTYAATELRGVTGTHIRFGNTQLWYVNMRNAAELLEHVIALPVPAIVREEAESHKKAASTLSRFTVALPSSRGPAVVLCLAPLFMVQLFDFSAMWFFAATLVYYAAIDPLFAALFWFAHLRKPIPKRNTKKRT